MLSRLCRSEEWFDSSALIRTGHGVGPERGVKGLSRQRRGFTNCFQLSTVFDCQRASTTDSDVTWAGTHRRGKNKGTTVINLNIPISDQRSCAFRAVVPVLGRSVNKGNYQPRNNTTSPTQLKSRINSQCWKMWWPRGSPSWCLRPQYFSETELY